MRTLYIKRLMVTTALTLPFAAAIPAQAQDQDACTSLEQYLEQDMPEGVSQTEEELNQILDEGDPAKCEVVNVELERVMQGQDDQDTAQSQTSTSQDDQQQSDSAVLAESESTRIQLSDEVLVEGEVFVERRPPEVDVNSGDTEVMVQSANPDVTVREQAGEILVRQAPATVRVDMPAPTITIEQEAPEIIVTMPPPGVDVANARPQVEVRQSEPQVTVRETTPRIDLQLSQAEDPENSQGVSVRDQASGQQMAQGETSEAPDAQVNLSRNEPVVTYQEGEDGSQQANVQIERSQPTVRYESAEPQIEFNRTGEPQVEFAQSGEPTVTFREQGEETQQASDQSDQQNQQQDAASTEDTSDEAVPLQSAQIDSSETADQQEQQDQQMAQADEQQSSSDTEVAQADTQSTEQTTELDEAEIESTEGELVTEGDTAQQTAQAEQPASRPAVQRDGYEMAEANQVVAEELTGHTVYGMNDEDIGEISELVLSSDGQVENVIIDVGGFLGLGEKPVLVNFDELAVMREQNGDDIRVYINSTEDELEEMERYAE